MNLWSFEAGQKSARAAATERSGESDAPKIGTPAGLRVEGRGKMFVYLHFVLCTVVLHCLSGVQVMRDVQASSTFLTNAKRHWTDERHLGSCSS